MQEIKIFEVLMFVIGVSLGFVQFVYFRTIDRIQKELYDERDARRKLQETVAICQKDCERKRRELKQDIKEDLRYEV
jgi:hypothetical protein